jgi:integrase
MARRRYQKGSIRKRGKRKPVWELQWWEDTIKVDGTIGRQRESAILGYVDEMTLRQARKAAEERLRRVNEGKQIPHSALTLRVLVEEFFVPLIFPTLKLSTQMRYKSHLRVHLLPAFGDRRLRDIGTADLQRFIVCKSERRLSWAGCNQLRNLFSKLFVSAKKWNLYMGQNPASEVELPAKQRVRPIKVLMPEQITELLRELREPVRTMVLVAVFTGLRIGELLGLQWQDLDLTKRELRVERAVFRGRVDSPKTRSSIRILPLPSCVIAALRTHREHKRSSGDYVFSSRRGTPFNDSNLLMRHLKPAGAKIGAPWLGWHTFRRTHATLLQLAGGSVKDAQAQLGHMQIATTLGIYTLPIPEHQRAAVEKLEQLVTDGDVLDRNSTARKTDRFSLQ